MSFEEEFDDIIRRKSNEARFPFDEKNWEKVSSMLDTERQAAKISTVKKVYLGGSLLLILFSAGLIINDLKTNLSAQSPATAGVKSDKALALSQAEESNIEALPAEAAQKKSALNNTATIAENKTAKLASASKSHSAVDFTLQKAAVRLQKKLFASAENNSLPAAARHASFEQDNTGAASVPPAEPVSKSAGAGNAKALPAISDSEPLNTSVNAQAEDGLLSEARPPAQEAIPAEAIQYQPLEPIYTFPADLKNEEILPVHFSTQAFYDDYYKKKYKTHFLNIEAGAAYLMGWNIKGGQDGKGLNGFAGLNYGLYLTRKLTVSVGTQLYNIGNIGQPFYSASKTEYAFGSLSTHTLITANTLYYAAVPLKISYIINKQSQLGLGFNMGYLINSKNTVQTYGLSDNVKVNAGTVKNIGAYNGIASANMQLSAFYKTQLSKRIALNGEIFYGLTDLFKNTLTIKNSERPVGLRLSLQFSLFDK